MTDDDATREQAEVLLAEIQRIRQRKQERRRLLFEQLHAGIAAKESDQRQEDEHDRD